MKKAAATRQMILEKAFEMIYKGGYQATSIDTIIAATQVTKGAFYYHFKSKDDMGLAIIDELLQPNFLPDYAASLEENPNPLDGIYAFIKSLLLENDFLKMEYGCPVANLTQEMTPWNAAFSNALQKLVKTCTDVMAAVLKKGKHNGSVRQDVNAEEVALFVFSGYWGVRNVGKLYADIHIYTSYLQGLKTYLKSLS